MQYLKPALTLEALADLLLGRGLVGVRQELIFVQFVNDPTAKYEYDEKYAGQEFPYHI